jgi:glycosyltransferase involved in cell wall biosynthesis
MIRSILEQTLADWELILVDDGSSDATIAAIEEFQDERIRILVDGQWRGLPTRLNEAVDAARAPFIARMDGDDIAYPERLERQMSYLTAHPEVDLVGASGMVFDGAGNAVGARRAPERHEQICRGVHGFYMIHPTFFGRTAWFRNNRYDPRMKRAQDQELLFRTHRHSRFANVPEILLGYREEAFSLGKSFRGRRDFVRALARKDKGPGRLIRSTEAVTVQLSKFAVEAVARTTGTSSHLLRHRAAPTSEAEVANWKRVWDRITSTPVPHATPGT